MKPPPASSRIAAPKTRFFGCFAVHHDSEKQTSTVQVNAPRLAAVSALALLLAYGLVVSAGYYWLHHVRKVSQIGWPDVALFRWKQVRREIAAEQFAKAKQAWEAKDYQAAYVAITSALRNDPDNISGRMMIAGFMQGIGAADSALKLLEDGLARAPDNRELIQQTFDLLTTTERDRAALALLHGKELAPQFSGPNGLLLRTFEVLATLNADGPAAARPLLDRYPELRNNPASWPVVARVLWEKQERIQAIATMEQYVRARPDNYAGYAQLAECQLEAGMVYDARATAARACAKFPKEIMPRILQIDTLAPARADEVRQWQQEVDRYLMEFGDKPEAILLLGNLAGRKGWVEVARLMYEVSVSRQQNSRPLALYYSDALMAHRRFEEARRVLAEIDLQAQNDAVLEPLLMQRQIVAASALGAHEDARDIARRLATQLGRDPEKIETIRQRFIKLGIPEAVAEFTARPLAPKDATPKKT